MLWRKPESNRRSVRIGAGLNWESERFVVAMKRVMIVERKRTLVQGQRRK